MTEFNFNCKNCNTMLSAATEWCGMETQCPQCGQTVTIPAAGEKTNKMPAFAKKIMPVLKKLVPTNKTAIIIAVLWLATLLINTAVTIFIINSRNDSSTPRELSAAAPEIKDKAQQNTAKQIYSLINSYLYECQRGNYSAVKQYSTRELAIFHNNLINWQIIGNRYSNNWNSDSHIVRVIIEACTSHGSTGKRHYDFFVKKQPDGQWKLSGIQDL